MDLYKDLFEVNLASTFLDIMPKGMTNFRNLRDIVCEMIFILIFSYFQSNQGLIDSFSLGLKIILIPILFHTMARFM